MSNYANFINLITNLTNRLNSIESNSKKTEELPLQTSLDPASKLRVSRGGTSEQISVGNIIDAVENQNFNQLLSVGEITVNPSSILIESGTTALINRLNYGVYTDTTIPIELADTGFKRKDILVITTDNVIVSIVGTQTDGPIVLAPPTPINSVFITDYDVTDSAIGIPTDPIVGTQFVKKSDAQPFQFLGSGSDAIIPLSPLGGTEIRLQNPALVSIAGYNLSEITGNPSAEIPYNGKPYVIRNLTGHDITIKNELIAADNGFFLVDKVDYILKDNDGIDVKYDVSGFYQAVAKGVGGFSEGFAIVSTADSPVLIGTTAGTKLIENILIPANTFTAGDIVRLKCRVERTVVTSGNTGVSMAISSVINDTVLNLGGVPKKFTGDIIGTTNKYVQCEHDIFIKSSTISQTISISSFFDNVQTSIKVSNNTNWTIDQYFYIVANNAQTDCSTLITGYSIERIRTT